MFADARATAMLELWEKFRSRIYDHRVPSAADFVLDGALKLVVFRWASQND
jgi:hypothetical protein